MNQSQEELTYEQTQTEELLIKAESELANAVQAKPVNKTLKKKLEGEVAKLKDHREGLRKIALEPQENE